MGNGGIERDRDTVGRERRGKEEGEGEGRGRVGEGRQMWKA